jgi:hypothetical protein
MDEVWYISKQHGKVCLLRSNRCIIGSILLKKKIEDAGTFDGATEKQPINVLRL